ncbi:hypothetical protein JTE90_011332 [Oedothorax gibbosus]|uniref:AB hydrolase-1 domain-containing protein n=1 Tax=Oedothorax gibbosus TaxID=931172 RepID=A0AAV6VKI2_9ARAC|nr:hypothetical protein JTE90_011332 [Oedothorax gibbosus]
MSFSWKTVDLKGKEIPEEIRLKKDCVEINCGFKLIQNAQVYYKEALPPADSIKSNVSVLLLHGQRFSSKTWAELGSIKYLAAMGFLTIAIDLPGYGESTAGKIDDKSEFLHSVFQTFEMDLPVVVSPSMSGQYALQYLLLKGSFLAGYVPVAPVGYEVLERLPVCKDKYIISSIYEPLQKLLYDPVPDLKDIETPTMVVFGEKDRSRSSALLSLLPNSQCQEIPNGSHPAYLDNPELWHQLLYNFLNAVAEFQAKKS